MDFYNAAVDMFIRPPRTRYNVSELGPKIFNVGPRSFYREDIEVGILKVWNILSLRE